MAIKNEIRTHGLQRCFYFNSVPNFIEQSEGTILGELAKNNSFSLEKDQRNAWLEEIQILKKALSEIGTGHLIFEYTIPRIGNRIDVVYIVERTVFLLEFKVGSCEYASQAVEQVTDYALDLKNFHKASHELLLVPMLIATRAPAHPFENREMKTGILEVIKCNSENLSEAINRVLSQRSASSLDAVEWLKSPYVPTPTIIEAAQALYRGHGVADISRSDASAVNLNQTTTAINEIIEKSKREHKKSICFITGVPGAGKTLAGLNIANERHKFDENEHAVFLSGNYPLVTVLQEALARDEYKRLGNKKNEAASKAKAFIQIIHHFRDDALSDDQAPIEKVAIFDEAQRAWTAKKLSNFMANNKSSPNFQMSEPEFLISVMDRHTDWAVIICLVGGGQEINRGEAGLIEWFESLKHDFQNWDVYVSDQMADIEYTKGRPMKDLFSGLKYNVIKPLHLAVSLRSFRSEKVAGFVKALLDIDRDTATTLYQKLHQDYPIYLTRDLDKAKAWIRAQAKGSERYGITASSGAIRLRGYGIWVQKKVDPAIWFLNDSKDVRSSCFLEEAATEFYIQGLELDWAIVCWDANFRFRDGVFEHYSFSGTDWENMKQSEAKLYLKNTYRVLLTRARQGMIIFIPPGSDSDKTRAHSYYDGTYCYLREIGIQEIE